MFYRYKEHFLEILRTFFYAQHKVHFLLVQYSILRFYTTSRCYKTVWGDGKARYSFFQLFFPHKRDRLVLQISIVNHVFKTWSVKTQVMQMVLTFYCSSLHFYGYKSITCVYATKLYLDIVVPTLSRPPKFILLNKIQSLTIRKALKLNTRKVQLVDDGEYDE